MVVKIIRITYIVYTIYVLHIYNTIFFNQQTEIGNRIQFIYYIQLYLSQVLSVPIYESLEPHLPMINELWFRKIKKKKCAVR